MRVLIFILANILLTSGNLDKVQHERDKLFNEELQMMIGSDIELSDSEIKANEVIMDLKNEELEHGFLHPGNFNVSKHFFEYKESVKKTKLYQLIKNMPKGAVLHAHDTAVLGPDYILSLTYWKDLFVCFDGDDINLLFSRNVPNTTCGTEWQLMRDARFSSGNVEKFDADLKQHFSLVIDNPEEVYTDINTVWSIFQSLFGVIGPVVTYKPVWEQYFYDTLKALREDGVMYFEVRSVLPQLYDLDGVTYDSVATAESYKKVVDQFMVDYPDFFGAKLIYAPLRLVEKKTVKEYLEIAREIKRRMPGFLAGFDLVGQEDLGRPLKSFMSELVEASKEFDLFLHAGETNWSGLSSDENLYDAIALGTKRIGHGYSIIKHPVLMREIKKKDIALEVNVVSNSVLKLVSDVRNHPLAAMLALDLPVVLSSDDPGLWEAEPLSHDFYVAFVGVASKHADLRVLKKLALNSLYYSTYPNKDKLVHDFQIRWTKFIDSVVRDKW
ncbi:adenosine deaminase-like [Anticarsia gemmatalis]|uniref:adenosine deaminase-like n=1 Tax=Anticarsia gemmatalis TaxID=129554 RepID=UPI003F75BC0F